MHGFILNLLQTNKTKQTNKAAGSDLVILTRPEQWDKVVSLGQIIQANRTFLKHILLKSIHAGLYIKTWVIMTNVDQLGILVYIVELISAPWLFQKQMLNLKKKFK